MDQVFKVIRWSEKRGPIFGNDELVLSPDMRKAYASELVTYINASPTTNERSLLTKNNVSLHAIEVLTIGGEWKILIKAFFERKY